MPRKVKYDKRGGLQITKAGYIRITANGPHKWKLLHRRTMELALEETHPLTLSVLGVQLDSKGKFLSMPERFDIHHIDGDKLHNNRENLMLLEHILHAKLFWEYTWKKKL